MLLATACVVSFGIDLYFNFRWTMQNGKNTETNITNQYMTQITPQNWVFMTWIVIYALLVIWFVYVFYLMCCRQLCSRNRRSPLFPGIFWLIFIIINVLNAIWLHLFMNRHMVMSGIILIVLDVMLYLICLMAYRICWKDITCNSESNSNNESNCNNSGRYNNDAESNNDHDVIELSYCEVWLLRFLTLNGLPLYAMWCTICTAIQWTIIFQYFTFHWSDNMSSIVNLSILSVIILIYWHVDHLVKREYFVYTWLPWIVLVVAFSGMIDRYHSTGSHNKPGLFFAFILLIVTSAIILFKVFFLCCCPPKHRNRGFSRV
jgi:hypothetical protein